LDSVVLGQLLKDAGYGFEILHANFQLREEESNRDEEFVKKIAEEWNVGIQVKRFDTHKAMLETGHGVQETARDLRYNWFDQVLNDADVDDKWLLTAHHADDQVETVLMNLFRGTGLAGLRGMKEKNGNRIRPLLSFFKKELESYAHIHHLRWVEDSSNQSSKYTRNFFRIEWLPEIEKVFPAVRKNIFETALRIAEAEQVYEKEIGRVISKLVQKKDGNIGVPVNLLKTKSPLDTILFALFSRYGFSAHQVPELKKLMEAPTGKFIVSDTHRVLKNREWMLIEKLEYKEQSYVVIEKMNSETPFAEGVIMMDKVSHEPINTDRHVACIGERHIKWPLILRPWKAGDYFYPLGMKKKKKISRFLTDLKLSKTEKERQWVLESDKKIIWVVGRRIDERCKLKSNNQTYFQMKFIPNN
jgi:tRNA(Ile)-lysidine synthase